MLPHKPKPNSSPSSASEPFLLVLLLCFFFLAFVSALKTVFLPRFMAPMFVTYLPIGTNLSAASIFFTTIALFAFTFFFTFYQFDRAPWMQLESGTLLVEGLAIFFSGFFPCRRLQALCVIFYIVIWRHRVCLLVCVCGAAYLIDSIGYRSYITVTRLANCFTCFPAVCEAAVPPYMMLLLLLLLLLWPPSPEMTSWLAG